MNERLVAAGLKAGGFAADVARTVQNTGRLSPKQKAVLQKELPRQRGHSSTAHYQYDSVESEIESNDFADAMGGSPWGD